MPISGCYKAKHPISGLIRIATGSPKAVYHTYGTAYAKLIRTSLPRTRTEVLVTAASEENISLVEKGGAEVGFTQADIVTTASSGSLTALARLYDDCLHLVVRSDSPIKSLADLRGRRVSIGESGSGTGVTTTRLLNIGGIDLGEDIASLRWGLDASAMALQKADIDAFFFSGGLPVAAITRLASTTPIRLISLNEYVKPLRLTFGAYYVERIIPTSTYSISPIVTIGTPNYLTVSAKMPRAMAYELTHVLFSGRDTLAQTHPAGARLNSRNAISTPPIQLHPGAIQYYRSAKI